MKIVTPAYYKDFKCIAGDCTDTCCAGWDVDVDDASYKKYLGCLKDTADGGFAVCSDSQNGRLAGYSVEDEKMAVSVRERLSRVMVPEEEGGCTFTLTEAKRCPFLNDANLCDLYTAYGEKALCDTCTEFPRFINEYGGTREIGLAPSCITAGELMLSRKEPFAMTESNDSSIFPSENDIDPELFLALKSLRARLLKLIADREVSIPKRLLACMDEVLKFEREYWEEENSSDQEASGSLNRLDMSGEAITDRGRKWNSFDVVTKYLLPFPGMEVINPDWNKLLKVHQLFIEDMFFPQDVEKVTREFDEAYKGRETEYEQLLSYYIYRYILDAVYDENVILKLKIMLVGWICVRRLDLAVFYDKKNLSFADQVDICHLYSRQFEHSYENFEWYTSQFEDANIYSLENLRAILEAEAALCD